MEPGKASTARIVDGRLVVSQQASPVKHVQNQHATAFALPCQITTGGTTATLALIPTSTLASLTRSKQVQQPTTIRVTAVSPRSAKSPVFALPDTPSPSPEDQTAVPTKLVPLKLFLPSTTSRPENTVKLVPTSAVASSTMPSRTVVVRQHGATRLTGAKINQPQPRLQNNR